MRLTEGQNATLRGLIGLHNGEMHVVCMTRTSVKKSETET